jgi:hypothetical protein
MEDIQTLTEEVTLLCEGNRLSNGATASKELTNLIEGTRDPGCRGLASKPTHGIITLFDPAMILFHSIVEGVATLVENFTTKRFADRAGIGAMTIRRHLLWHMTNRLKRLLEKALSSLHISLFDSA